jgi:hypothetical protein
MRRHELRTLIASSAVASLTTVVLLSLLGAKNPSFERKVLNELAALRAAASAPGDVFAVEACVKGALKGEGGYSAENELEIEGEGRIGAEAFGNGLMARLRAVPGAKIGGAVKGELGSELAFCFDLRELASRIRAGDTFGLDSTAQALVLKLESADEAALISSLVARMDGAGLDPGQVEAKLAAVEQLSFDLDPAVLADGGGPLATLAQSLPLPPALAARISDGGSVMQRFQSLDLCDLPNAPQALTDVTAQACALAADEPFSQILTSVNSRTSNLVTRVAAVQSTLSQLPNQVVNAFCNQVSIC